MRRPLRQWMLLGEEGGVPPILIVSRGGPYGWGVYLRTHRYRLAFGPRFGWIWEEA